MKVFLLFSVTAFIFNGCESQKPLPYTTELRYDSVYFFPKNEIPKTTDPNFGVHLYEAVDTAFIFALNKERNISYYSINKEQKGEIPFSDKISACKYVPATLNNQDLYVQDFKGHRLLQFTVNAFSITSSDTFSLNWDIDWNNFFFNPQYYQSFEIIDSSIYASYGKISRESYFRDTFAYLKMALYKSANTQKIIKWLPMPKDYLQGKYRNSYTFLKRINDSLCFYCFEDGDSIFTYNLPNGRRQRAISIGASSNYRKFNFKKVYDLAYVRWYDGTTGENSKVLVNAGRILLLKRLIRESLKDTIKYEYYLFDSNLNLLKHNLLKHSINPSYCFSFRNGFLLLNDTLEKGYYYDTGQ